MSSAQKKIFALIVVSAGTGSFLLGLTLASHYRSTLFAVGAFCLAMFANLYLMPSQKHSEE